MKNSAAALALVIAIGYAAPAWAQDKADFAALQTTLKQEDNVTVTTLAGDKIKGRMVGVSGDAIVLRTNGVPRTVDAVHIQKVQKRKNGVLLGAVIGAGAAIPFAVGFESYSYNEGGGGGGIAAIALGVGIGIGIDAAIGSNKTLYERNSGKTVTVAPLIDKKGGVGGRVAIKF